MMTRCRKWCLFWKKMAVVTMETGINQSALRAFFSATNWPILMKFKRNITYDDQMQIMVFVLEKMAVVTMETGINQSALKALFSATNRPILMKIDRNITYDDQMQKMVFVLVKMAVVTMETGINQSALIIIIIILSSSSSSSFRPATLSAADLSNRWSDVFDT